MIISRAWLLAVVHARQNKHKVVLNHVKERIWKSMQDCTPDFAFDALIQLGVRCNMSLSPFECLDECASLIDIRLAVSDDPVFDFDSRGWLVTNLTGHYLMPALALISASVTVGSPGCVRWCVSRARNSARCSGVSGAAKVSLATLSSRSCAN